MENYHWKNYIDGGNIVVLCRPLLLFWYNVGEENASALYEVEGYGRCYYAGTLMMMTVFGIDYSVDDVIVGDDVVDVVVVIVMESTSIRWWYWRIRPFISYWWPVLLMMTNYCQWRNLQYWRCYSMCNAVFHCSCWAIDDENCYPWPMLMKYIVVFWWY